MREAQVLLVRNLLIGGDQNFETSPLRRQQQSAILQASQTCVAFRLTFVLTEQVTQSLIDALVQ